MTTRPASQRLADGGPPRAPSEKNYEVDDRWFEVMVTMTADQCYVAFKLLHWAAEDNLLDCGIRDIAERTGMNRKTVDRTLHLLKKSGVVRIRKASGSSTRVLIEGVRRVWKFAPQPFTITDWNGDDSSDGRGHLGSEVGPPASHASHRKFDGIPHPAEQQGPPQARSGATPKSGGPTRRDARENPSDSDGIRDSQWPHLTGHPAGRSSAERSAPDSALLSRPGAKPSEGASEANPKEAPETESTGKGRKQGRRGATMGLSGLEAPAKPKAIKRRMPEGWAPSDKHAALAKALGLDLQWEADHFRDWCGARGEGYVDWEQAFSNRLRNAKKYQRGGGAAGTGGPQEPVAPQALRPMATIKTGELLAPMLPPAPLARRT